MLSKVLAKVLAKVTATIFALALALALGIGSTVHAADIVPRYYAAPPQPGPMSARRSAMNGAASTTIRPVLTESQAGSRPALTGKPATLSMAARLISIYPPPTIRSRRGNFPIPGLAPCARAPALPWTTSSFGGKRRGVIAFKAAPVDGTPRSLTCSPPPENYRSATANRRRT